MISNPYLKILNSTQEKLLLKNEKLIICMHPLNIINENSKFSENITILLKKNFFYFRIFILLIINFLKFLIVYFKVYIFILINQSKKKINSEIIFLSHKFPNNNKDLYFSDIKKKINKTNFQTVYIDQLKFFDFKKNSHNLLHSQNCNLKDYKIFFFETCNIFVEVLLAFNKKKKIEKMVMGYLLSYVFSTATIRNKLIYLSLKNLINTQNLKKIIHTFEGHIYEKYLNLQLRKDSNKIEIIGYQHTGLNGYENALFQFSKKKFLPNKVLCVSNIDRKIIKNKTKLHNVYNIGRHIPEKKMKNWKLRHLVNVIPRILVLVENDIDLIKNFIYKINEFKHLINITIRPHPETLSLLKNYSNIPKISYKKNFREELKKYDVLIFQNSTIHYEAIRKGLLVLRINSNSKLNFLNKSMQDNIRISNLNDVIKKINEIKKFNFKNYLKYAEMKFPYLNIDKLNHIM